MIFGYEEAGLGKTTQKLGWFQSRHGNRHDVWTDEIREIVIPRHNEINEYTAKAILKEAEEDNK